jgi:hypothetical protein
MGRFAMGEDLTSNTSPEVLGAVGSRYPAQYSTYNWSPSLTSTAQGVKRPLNVSTRINQQSSQEHTPLSSNGTIVDGYKVSLTLPLRDLTC